MAWLEILRSRLSHTESDPCAILLQLLVAFGNVVGRQPHFRVEASRHSMNLFCALVGTSSKARKGTSWDYVANLFHATAPDWCERIETGASSGEGLVYAVRDAVVTMRPVNEKGKVVGQEPVEEDPGVNDKRLLDLEPEFAQVLRVFAREGNTLSAQFRNAWDKGDLRTLTKSSRLRASEAHISIIGHITRGELVRHLTNTEAGNGFANRFLWVCVHRSKLLPEGGRIEEVDFYPLVQRLQAAINSARDIAEIRRDEQARALWHSIYAELSAEVPGLLGSVTARAEAQTMRLSCIYALLDGSAVVREVHLRAALAMWRYAEASARYIFGESLGDPIADKILDALADAPYGLTTAQLHVALGNNAKGERITSALSALAGSKRIYGETVRREAGKPGRPGQRWRLAPQQLAHATPYERNEENELISADYLAGNSTRRDRISPTALLEGAHDVVFSESGDSHLGYGHD